MFGYQKVGGLTFIRVGSLSMSFCVTRKAVRNPVRVFEELDGLLAVLAVASLFIVF